MKTVPLHGKKAAGRVALVDDADYDLVMPRRWWVLERKIKGQRGRGPYAVTRIVKADGRRSLISMHQVITGYPMTDHKNHDGLDNRRSNLRPATKVQNGGNSRPYLGASSRYKGVHWHSQRRAWRAAINHQGKNRHLGTFSVEEDAALAYDIAARELFGEYAALNLPHLTHLPAPQRRVKYPAAQDDLILTLKDRDGLPFAEIARRLDMPRTSVRRHYLALKGSSS